MRRQRLFPVLGLLELAAAVALLALAVALPSDQEIRRSMAAARQVTGAAGAQVRIAREEISGLRQAELTTIADRFRETSRLLAETTRQQRIDFEALAAVSDALGQSAEGLAALSDSIDPEAAADLAAGLAEVAGWIDGRLIPAANDAAAQLDASSAPLAEGVRQLAAALEAVPADLAPLRAVHDSLAQLDEGLAAASTMIDPRRLAALRDAADGAEGVVTEAARLAERAAGYTYPIVTLDGIRPTVRQQPFWPQAGRVGTDLRRVGRGMTALQEQAEALARELPTVQASLTESRRGLATTRAALGTALERQEDVERLLTDLPARATRLAGELPRLSDELSGALRETGRLGELANALQAAGAALQHVGESWPRLQSGLAGTVVILRTTRAGLDGALQHRAQYEAARDDVADLSAQFASALPTFVAGLNERLDAQAQTLDGLGQGLAQADAALPVYERSLVRCLQIGRLLACLVALIAALHGAHLLAPAFFRPARPEPPQP